MTERSVGTPVLRRINTGAVLTAVRELAPQPARLAEIVERTGLTRPTVAQAVDALLAAGLLRQHDPETTPGLGGRPAVRVSLHDRAAPVLGLDVGPHTVSAGIANLAGERLAVVRRKVTRRGARGLLRIVADTTSEALDAAGLDAGGVTMVAAGTPGLVDPETGRVLLAPSVPGWTRVNLAEHLGERFSCPVRIDNDANLAALAVASRRHPSGTLLVVQWGERLGAGIVIDGRLHRGAGAAGEIGFIRPPGDTVDDEDGRGPLERRIGAEAIAELAGRPDGAAVFAAAADGDPAATAAVDEVAATFARSIAPALLALAPHTVVIVGGVARAGDVLLSAVARHLEPLTLSPPALELSELAEDTVLTGALQLAQEESWQRVTASLAAT